MNAIKSQTRKAPATPRPPEYLHTSLKSEKKMNKEITIRELKGNENWIPTSPRISNTGHRKAMKQNLKTENW